jgi:transcriptional regulator with XRE-family HTH domain
MAEKNDESMENVRTRFTESGLSLHALGLAMGYDEKTARQSAFQFMKTSDPHVSMLRRFAKAMGITVEELLAEKKKSRSK